MIKYKFDILKALAEKGYTSKKIRNDKLLAQRTLTNLRKGEYVSTTTLIKICNLLNCKLSDLIEYVPD